NEPLFITGSPFQTDVATCQGQTLQAGQSCILSVTYTPTAIGTSPGGSIVINANTAATSYTIALQGSGIAAPTSTPTSLATSTPTITPTPVRTPTVAPTLTPEATFPAIST